MLKKNDVLVPKGQLDGYPKNAMQVSLVDEDGVHCFPLGGGFGRILRHPENWEVVPPDTEPALHLARFSLCESKPVIGWTDSHTWNGWGTPSFEREEADKLVEILNKDPDGFRLGYSEELNAFVATDREGSVEIFRVETLRNGKEVWDIGSHSWCWDEEPLHELAES